MDIQCSQDFFRAALHMIDPQFPLPAEGYWSIDNRADVIYALHRQIELAKQFSVKIEDLQQFVSLNPNTIEGGKTKVEMYALFPDGTWQSSVDSVPYVFISDEVPKAYMESLAIAALERFYNDNNISTVALGVYNMPEDLMEEEENADDE